MFWSLSTLLLGWRVLPKAVILACWNLIFWNTELILTIVEAPTWIEISGFSLSGLPTVDNIGSYQVSLSISDNIDVVTETFNVLVQEVNDYPITSDVSFISDEDQELEIILSATDEESEELTFDIVSQPQYGTITSNRSLEYFIYIRNNGIEVTLLISLIFLNILYSCNDFWGIVHIKFSK